MEKSEIIKVIIQYLNNKGYREIGNRLELESNISLEASQFTRLKQNIKEDKYEEAIDIVLQHCSEREQIYIIPKIRMAQIFYSVLKNHDDETDKNMVNQNETIDLIRTICNSGNIWEKDIQIEKSSILVFIHSKSELIKKMKEISPVAFTKESLIDYIEMTLSKSKSLLKSLHPRSLETMIDGVVKRQVKKCLYHTNNEKNGQINNNESDNRLNNCNKAYAPLCNFSYFENHECKKTNIPYKTIFSLEKHDEEITNLIPSATYKYFAAILKTNFVVIYRWLIKSGSSREIYLSQFLIIKAHEGQVTSLQWNTKETLILTASKDKTVKVFDIATGECKIKIEEPTGNMFSSAIFYDNETKILSSCLGQKLILWTLEGNLIDTVTTVTVNEILFSKKLNLIILVAPTIKAVILFDYASKLEIDKLIINDTIISTSLSKLDDGDSLLVNCSNTTPVISLWCISERSVKRKYFGHRQEKLTTKCGFGGENENFIVSGSDTKEIFIWHRNSSIPISVIKAHASCVNTVLWPSDSNLSNVLISGSDDHTIKIIVNDRISKVNLIEKEKFKTIASSGYRIYSLNKNSKTTEKQTPENNLLLRDLYNDSHLLDNTNARLTFTIPNLSGNLNEIYLQIFRDCHHFEDAPGEDEESLINLEEIDDDEEEVEYDSSNEELD